MTTVRTVTQESTSMTVVAQELETRVRVTAKEVRSEGVVLIQLADADGRPLPAWSAGSHVDVLLEGLPARQYSLCGDPADHETYRLGVLRDENGRGTSRYLHDNLQVGDVIGVRGPRNNFPLRESPRYLFIAGGIGITPVLPMIRAAETAGAEWQLVYGGRRRASMALLDELAAYGDRVSVRPQDETGLLDLAAILGEPRTDTLVYCCGPEPLLLAVETACSSWPSHSLKVERFSAKPLSEPQPSCPFEVVLKRSGLTLTVPPDRSVLETVRSAGVAVLSSCTEGTCGTCETAVLAGEVDHRDSILDDEEKAAQDCMFICVSRALSTKLVLDL